MPDEPMIVQQAAKTWKERAIEFAFQQGPATVIMIVVSCFFGFYIYNEMPKRDAVWSAAFAAQSAEFKQILEDRDTRNLAYRTKADDKHAESVKALIEDSDKQYRRLESLMLAMQKHGIILEKKIEAAMQ